MQRSEEIKMIELSITDVMFICWGGIATGLAGHFYSKEKAHGVFVHALIKNPDLRKEFFDKMDSMREKEA